MQIRTVLSGAIAVGLLASASAHAELALPSDLPTNSSLFVTVFDTVNQESFTTDLGLFYNDFVDNTVVPGTLRPGPLTPLSYQLDMSIFADNNPNDLLFNVHAGDSAGAARQGGILMTALAAPVLTNGLITGVLTQATGLITTVNTNCPSTNGCAGTFGNESLWGSGIANFFPGGSAAGFDEALGFYLIAGNTSPGSTTLGTTTAIGDGAGAWNWLLTENGTLTFSGSSGTPIPLPAAVWLLISGLAGLGALGRRSGQKA